MSGRKTLISRESADIRITLKLMEDLLGEPTLGPHHAAALGTYLHNVYSGVEKVLRFLMQKRGARVVKAEDWHKKLLSDSREAGIVTEEEWRVLKEALSFRHLYVHGYAHRMKEQRLRELASPVPALVRRFLRRVAAGRR